MVKNISVKSISILIFVLSISLSAFAQEGIVRGFVYDTKTGEPIIFTNVILEGTSMGASTDVNGFYSITKVPSGSYNITATYLGYDTARVAVKVVKNKIVTQKLFITEAVTKLNTFTYSAEKQESRSQVKMSVANVTPKEIASIPSVGGEPDLAQYLQVLPGITFTGDQGGQLYIRGGSPVQNKVLLDGMTIYNPFHSIGLFSVFDTDIMRNADVYTGGFNAEYGGRISSVMDITTRDGNKKEVKGKVSTSTFGAKLLLEGPIKKASNEGTGSSSFIFSAKHSYLDQSSILFQPYFKQLTSNNARGVDSLGLPYGFTDVYGKIAINGTNGNKVNFFGFNFKDNVAYANVSQLDWNAAGGGMNFILVPGSAKTLIEGVVSYSNYSIEFEEQESLPRRSEIGGFNIGMDFTTFSGENQFKYGFEINGASTDFLFFNSVGRQIEQLDNTTELSGFLMQRINTKKMVIEPSFRMQYYASLNNWSPEPRLGLKYNVNDVFRVKAALGMYSQNLISANSDRDVVNLFYGFLTGPDNLQEEFVDENGNAKEVSHKLQKANHAILGAEVDLNEYVSLNIEGYYKRFKQLTNTNRNKLYDDNATYRDEPDVLKKDFIIETGNAYGVDMTLKYSSQRAQLWLVYSLSEVDRWDGILSYNPVFDRRHNVNLVFSYILGEERNWELNARWNLGSGFPFTQTQGFYEGIDFSSINENYTTTNGNINTEYAALNQGRLPYYHRLDLSVKRKWSFTSSVLEANAGITNVYNRDNLFYINSVTLQEVYQLPVLPSLGLSFRF